MCSPLCVFIHTTAQFISPCFHFRSFRRQNRVFICSFSSVFVLPPNGRFIHISKVAAVINCVSFLLHQSAWAMLRGRTTHSATCFTAVLPVFHHPNHHLRGFISCFILFFILYIYILALLWHRCRFPIWLNVFYWLNRKNKAWFPSQLRSNMPSLEMSRCYSLKSIYICTDL